MKKASTQSSQVRVIGALIGVTVLVLLVLKIASDSDSGRDPIAARTTAAVDPFLRSRVRIVCKNRSGQSQTFALSLLRGSEPDDVIKTIHSTCSIPLHHSISLRDGAGGLSLFLILYETQLTLLRFCFCFMQCTMSLTATCPSSLICSLTLRSSKDPKPLLLPSLPLSLFLPSLVPSKNHVLRPTPRSLSALNKPKTPQPRS
jgi:hypothetical protein